MKRMVLVAGLFFALFTGVCHAQLVVNGGFELGYTGDARLAPTTTVVQGWTVGGNVDWIFGLWQPAEGTKSIDLNGNSVGSLSQVITTAPGTTYELSFWLAGNPSGLPTIKTLDVKIDGVALVWNPALTFDTTNHSLTSMGWTEFTHDFTASGSATTIEFLSTTTLATGATSPYGPALDNVEVEAVTVGVPEPSVLYLLACGLLGLMATRRKRG